MFQKQMKKGYVSNSALQLLTSNQCKGMLLLDGTTTNELIKHPEASPMDYDVLIQGITALVNEVIYNVIGESEILQVLAKVKLYELI